MWIVKILSKFAEKIFFLTNTIYGAVNYLDIHDWRNICVQQKKIKKKMK